MKEHDCDIFNAPINLRFHKYFVAPVSYQGGKQKTASDIVDIIYVDGRENLHAPHFVRRSEACRGG